jgi:hypothetical protein
MSIKRRMNYVRMIVREKNKNKKQLDFKSGFENPKLILPNEKCCHENKTKTRPLSILLAVKNKIHLLHTRPATTAKPFLVSQKE